MSDEDRYNDHISAVLQECPGADRDEVKSAFQKYEEEFFIPPQDAIRSIIRRFKSESDASPATPKTLSKLIVKSAIKIVQIAFKKLELSTLILSS